MAKRTRTLLGWGLGSAILLHATAVLAAFHLVVIEEVFFGTEDCPDAQYVELRSITFGQNFVANQRMTTQTADGTAAADFGRFMTNLPNGGSGAAMLMGTAAAQALFGIDFDQVVTGTLVQPDGRVCFGSFGGSPVDCVAYGNYTGSNPGNGSPALAPVLGMALVRRSDTNNNTADFILGLPMPENNAAELGALGECPSTDPTPTPTVPATPTATTDIRACTGDCNRDFAVTVDEIVRSVTIALGSSPIDGCPEADADASGTVTVDEIVSAVNNGLNGCA